MMGCHRCCDGGLCTRQGGPGVESGVGRRKAEPLLRLKGRAEHRLGRECRAGSLQGSGKS